MNTNKFLLLLSLLFFHFTILAQINLIPQPQKVEQQKGFFEIRKNISLVSNYPSNHQNQALVKWLKEAQNIEFNATARIGKNSIQLLRQPDQSAFSNFLKQEKLDSSFEVGEEGYVLQVTRENIKIISTSHAGIFYGIQTLKQLITANTLDNKIPCLVIYDKPDFPVRAWQDDISRGPIPTMDMLKDQIRNMSAYKLNYFTLYTEHTFKLDKHPGIAPEDGITKQELRELAEFARKHHVTLIGNYQSFGHMEETLVHPDYKHLAENDHIISPALEESYDFLRDVYSEIVPVYDGQFFNINCDETFGLGEGKSKAMVEKLGIDGVYLYHINRLNDLLQPYGKSILMWGDIAVNHPRIVKELPKDITVIAWGYHAAKSFDSSITPITATGLNFWVAPGVSCWRNVYPSLNTAKVNIFNFVRDGHKHGASGILNTTWDDDGFNLFQNNWHGLSWGAEVSWNAPDLTLTEEYSAKEMEERYAHFNQTFDQTFYGLKKESLTEKMNRFTALSRGGVKNIFINQRFFEPVFPIHAEYVQPEKRAQYLKELDYLKILNNEVEAIAKKVSQNQESTVNLIFAIRQVQFTLKKNLLRMDVNDFMNGRKNVSASQLKQSIRNLALEAGELKASYKELWLKENRFSWLNVNMKKYDELIQGIQNLEGHCFITAHNELTEKGRKITIEPLFEGKPVYYEINKDNVSPDSKKYTGPLYLKSDAKITAKVIQEGKSFPLVIDSLIYHKGIGKLTRLNATPSHYHPSYDGGGKMALLDGKLGNPAALRSGRWQGFSSQNIELEIDMGERTSLNTFTMGCFQNTHSWVILPKNVRIYGKDTELENYRLIKTIEHNISPKEGGSFKHLFEAELGGKNVRYLKVVAEWYGKLPEWHHAGSKYDSMLFADEIIIK